MPWITGGAIIGSAILGGMASNSAAKKQASAAGRAAEIQKEMFDQTQAQMAPWIRAGRTSLSELQGLMPQLNAPFDMSKFQQSPAYQFNLDQGMQAINKAAAARGNFYAPATLQDVSRFSQGLASNEFQNAFNNYRTQNQDVYGRLFGMSGSGQNAAANLGGFGAGMANNMGQAVMQQGNAQAAGLMGMGNAIQGAGQNYLNYNIWQDMLKGMQQPTFSQQPAQAGPWADQYVYPR